MVSRSLVKFRNAVSNCDQNKSCISAPIFFLSSSGIFSPILFQLGSEKTTFFFISLNSFTNSSINNFNSLEFEFVFLL